MRIWERLIRNLNHSIRVGECVVACERVLRDSLRYVAYEKGGGVGPKELEDQGQGARAVHGDETISLALMNEAFTWSTRSSVPTATAPEHSPAARKRRRGEQEQATQHRALEPPPQKPIVQGWQAAESTVRAHGPAAL